MPKKEDKDTALKITEIMKVGPRVPKIKGNDWEFLVYELRKMKITPGEAYRIIAQKKVIPT